MPAPTTIEVQLPPDHPLPFVSVQPKPGWTVETETRTLDEPVDAFGEEVTEVVDTVTWSGGPIGPGEFDTFSLSVGPLPDDVDELAFRDDPDVQQRRGGRVDRGDAGGRRGARAPGAGPSSRGPRGGWSHRRRRHDDHRVERR